MLAYYPILIFLAPLVASVVTACLGSRFSRKAYSIGLMTSVVSLVISIIVLCDVGASGNKAIYLPVFSSELSGLLQFDLNIDRLAAVMMVLISGVCLLISRYSAGYMQSEQGRVRFHSLMYITTFSLLCMVSSANLLMLFVFWQLLSWLLSLLSHNYSHPATVKSAFKTFTILRLGDIAFLGGIVLAYRLYGTLDFREIFTQAAEISTTFSIWPGGGLEINAITAITLLIFVGAMSKSAQFPLHTWLPESLYAPTPVHALLHAGIINAGGFLLNRLAPLYIHSPATMHVIFVIGLLTTVVGASIMLTQNDIKKTLGHSTIGQMGYMIMECGLGAFALAIFHLIAHGLFKGSIFLNCGRVIHDARRERKLPYEHETAEWKGFSFLAWITGFITTLVLPLIIILAVHGVLKIPVKHSEGAVILLFFCWMTSSQVIMTLYQLRIASWKVVMTMLLALVFSLFTYFLAVEKFTDFLYPSVGQVDLFYHAAALPGIVFDFLVVAITLFVILGWILFYARAHGKTIRMPKWINAMRNRIYLLLINRLYLDDISIKVCRRFTCVARLFNNGKQFRYLLILIACGLVVAAIILVKDMSITNVVIFFALALMLPLFPFHGVYVAALSRLPGILPVFPAFIMPAVGFYGAMVLLPKMSIIMLKGVSVLALCGAVYGSIKAMMQYKTTHTSAYMGVALYSILWWYLANTGTYTPQAAAYASAVTLVISGLIFAWYCVRVRYGDMSLDMIGGLAQSMPRFGLLLALLVMAAVGLPPFGLFSGYMAILFNPSITLSWDLIIILLSWLAVSWYLFKLMQRMLFGPLRSGVIYKDLRLAEVVIMVIVILVLVVQGITPYGFCGSLTFTNGYNLPLEISP
ncbi:MAG: proton-conducting transporter transmembrane domain-containing protein [Candidatus Anammoxibacter sp.]